MTDASYLHAIRLLVAASPRLDTPFGLADAQAAAALAALHQLPMGLAHALAHVVAGRCRTPHAQTHGVIAPAVMRFNLPVVAVQQRHIAEAFGVRTDGQSAPTAAWGAVNAVRRFGESLRAPSSLRELGVPEAALDSLAEASRADPGFATNPRPLGGTAEVRQVLDWAWSGEIPAP
jgi:alcohol dehydrogenase class IV